MVKHDDYMTPYKAWADICKYLPRDRKVWEAFRGDGTSRDHPPNMLIFGGDYESSAPRYSVVTAFVVSIINLYMTSKSR
jgi:hypothetical protein